MRPVVDDNNSSSSTLSAAPSLSNSKLSLGSHCSQKSTCSQKSVNTIPPPTREETIGVYLEKAKWYTSVCLGTTAILSVFAFLFLIPFVVDPAISTIVADYDPEPITCVVSDHTYSEGMKNCTWSSCREGCTTAQTRCHQMTVNYTKITWEEWLKNPREIELVNWDVSDTKFLINTEGCGYPPRVNCTIFSKEYGYEHVHVRAFPCYYSKAYPQLVVARYSWDSNLNGLIMSLIIPNVLFFISIGVLSYWYCCDKACHKSPKIYNEKFPSKENQAILCDDEEEDEDY
ncbi:unnamed protein product [Diamesa serratosioi]